MNNGYMDVIMPNMLTHAILIAIGANPPRGIMVWRVGKDTPVFKEFL